MIIIAALPREIRALVRGTAADTRWLGQGIHLHHLPEATAVAAGMGENRVLAAWQALLESGFDTGCEPLVLSVGLAGACASTVRPGDVRTAREVVDTRTGERWPADASLGSLHAEVLASSGAIANVGEKRRLHDTYGATLVDMEAAAVARLAAAAGMRFAAVKAVSDAHDFEMQSLARFASAHGHFRTGAFALHTALRPHRWRPTMRLGSDSNRALTALTAALQGIITSEAKRR